MKRMRTIRLAALTLAASAIIAGCGKGRTVTLVGSDTLILLARQWADAYMKDNRGATIRVENGGTVAGAVALARGGADICMASRPLLKDEGAAVKAKRGAEARETVVARDGVAIYVNERNPVDEISLAHLKDVFAGRAANWKQVGGPVVPIVVFGRETGSGTREWFSERVMGGQDFAPTVQPLRDTEALVTAVAKDSRAVGYGSYVFARGVRVIRIGRKHGERGIEPSPTTIAAGRYPLTRDLYFCTAGEPAGETAAFIKWVLSPGGQKACQDAGFVPVGKTR